MSELPPYLSTPERIWHYGSRAICAAIFFSLIFPLIVVVPLSFNAVPFFTFTKEMLSLDPAGYSLKWYENFFTSLNWQGAVRNSLIIAFFATLISTSLGTLAALDARTRREHADWHGTVLRWDHPFWQSHYPPNGWHCRCIVQQLDDDDLEDFGYEPSGAPPQGSDETRPWTNKRTGETVQVPRGIDPGFQHNAGLVGRTQPAQAQLTDKIAASPPDLAAAARS